MIQLQQSKGSGLNQNISSTDFNKSNYSKENLIDATGSKSDLKKVDEYDEFNLSDDFYTKSISFLQKNDEKHRKLFSKTNTLKENS